MSFIVPMPIAKAPILAAFAAASLTFSAIAAPAALAQTAPDRTFPVLDGIELTADQRDRAEAIARDTVQDLQGTLDADQRAALQASVVESGASLRAGLAELDLSAQQQQEIRRAMEAALRNLRGILTPAQQRQFRQNLRALRDLP